MNAVLKKVTHPTRSTNRDADERFFHFRNVNMAYENGRTVRDVTAFIRRLPDGTYAAAYAECDERDAFCRTRGRTVARRKWFAGKRTATFAERPSYEELLRTWTGAPESVVNEE
jgi:hypothetical protein